MPPAGTARIVQFDSRGAYLAWPHLGRFALDRLGRLTVDASEGNERFLRFAILGPVLAAMLELRGTPLLHGSAVAFRGRAILFVGHKRAGKSTVAAACAANGCGLLNDDVLPLLSSESGVTLRTGFPAVKLSPAAKSALLPDWPVAGETDVAPDDKLVVTEPHHQTGVFPISAVVVLDGSTSLLPEMISPSSALPQILAHGYALKFGMSALKNGQSEALFEACARLSRDTVVIRVGRPDRFDRAKDFAGSLLEFTNQAASQACGHDWAKQADPQSPDRMIAATLAS